MLLADLTLLAPFRRKLRDVGVDILTLGQYLRPTPKHLAVERFVNPEEFAMLQAEGMEMGFRYVAAGPLVRSSYKAAEAFVRGLVRRVESADGGFETRRRLLPVVP